MDVMKKCFLLTSILAVSGCIHATVLGGLGQVATYKKIDDLEKKIKYLEDTIKKVEVVEVKPKSYTPSYVNMELKPYIPSYVDMELFKQGFYGK